MRQFNKYSELRAGYTVCPERLDGILQEESRYSDRHHIYTLFVDVGVGADVLGGMSCVVVGLPFGACSLLVNDAAAEVCKRRQQRKALISFRKRLLGKKLSRTAPPASEVSAFNEPNEVSESSERELSALRSLTLC